MSEIRRGSRQVTRARLLERWCDMLTALSLYRLLLLAYSPLKSLLTRYWVVVFAIR